MCCGKKVQLSQPPLNNFSAAVDYDDSQPTLIATSRQRIGLSTLRMTLTVEAGNMVRLYQEEYDALIADGAPISIA